MLMLLLELARGRPTWSLLATWCLRAHVVYPWALQSAHYSAEIEIAREDYF